MRSLLARIDINRLGSRLKEKLVVIESDDWGSHRMPSKQAYKSLLNNGVPVDKSPYTRYDGLERDSDIENLLGILNNHKGVDGKPVCFTANTVVGNPNFEKIKKSDFKEYAWVNIKETYDKAEDSNKALNLIHEGIQNSLWMPQFHGREHVNVKRWMQFLKEKKEPFYSAFEQGVWGLSNDLVSGPSIQASFETNNTEESIQIIKEGLSQFETIFGFRSTTFIANNYIWSEALNKGLMELGIEHFQGMKLQLLPKLNFQEKRKTIRRKTGEFNEFGQTYAVRNCHFEPTERGHTVEKVLQEVSSSFFWKKPAIICTHRINYTSRLDVKKRDENLRNLDLLLTKIIEKWPDARFISSVELAKVLKNDRGISM